MWYTSVGILSVRLLKPCSPIAFKVSTLLACVVVVGCASACRLPAFHELVPWELFTLLCSSERILLCLSMWYLVEGFPDSNILYLTWLPQKRRLSSNTFADKVQLDTCIFTRHCNTHVCLCPHRYNTCICYCQLAINKVTSKGHLAIPGLLQQVQSLRIETNTALWVTLS